MPIDAIEHTHFECRFPGLKRSLWGYGKSGTVTSWHVLSDFLTPTDGWDVTAVDFDDEPTWYEMQPVEIYVDGRRQLVGRCDKTRRGGKDGSIVQLWGRDYIADMTECNIDPSMAIKKGQTLNSAILTALAPSGITTLDDPLDRNNERTGGTGGTAVKLTAKEVSQYKPRDDDSQFGWCNRIAARHGYTLQPSTRREAIVLQAPTYGTAPIASINVYRDPEKSRANNVIESYAERDFSAIPTWLLCTGQGGHAHERRTKNMKKYDMVDLIAHLGFTELTQIFKIAARGRWMADPAEVRDSAQQGLLYRLRTFRDKISRNQSEINGASARMKAEALKQTLIYEAKIRGTKDPISGLSWATDTIVNVHDDRARVYEQLWIASRHWGVENRGGATTTVKAWRPRTFQINPED